MMDRFEKEYAAYLAELRKTAQVELRVREVPLQLTGPIPEGSLLEDLGQAAEGAAAEAVAPAPGTSAAPTAAAERRPAPAPVQATGDDEISTTGSTGPEKIAPPASTPPPAPKPDETKPPGR